MHKTLDTSYNWRCNSIALHSYSEKMNGEDTDDIGRESDRREREMNSLSFNPNIKRNGDGSVRLKMWMNAILFAMKYKHTISIAFKYVRRTTDLLLYYRQGVCAVCMCTLAQLTKGIHCVNVATALPKLAPTLNLPWSIPQRASLSYRWIWTSVLWFDLHLIADNHIRFNVKVCFRFPFSTDNSFNYLNVAYFEYGNYWCYIPKCKPNGIHWTDIPSQQRV